MYISTQLQPLAWRRILYQLSSKGSLPHTQIHILIAAWRGWLPGGASGKEPACQCKRHETWFRSLGGEDALEKDIATHSSILAWRFPWTEEPRLHSVGVAKREAQLKRLSTHCCMGVFVAQAHMCFSAHDVCPEVHLLSVQTCSHTHARSLSTDLLGESTPSLPREAFSLLQN